MGLSATRLQHGPYDHSQPTGFGQQLGNVLDGAQTNPALPPQPLHSPLPLNAQMPQLQPGQYPRLQGMANSGNPLMAVLGRSMMSGMENRRIQAGMSPEDWQARINARFAARRAARGF